MDPKNRISSWYSRKSERSPFSANSSRRASCYFSGAVFLVPGSRQSVRFSLSSRVYSQPLAGAFGFDIPSRRVQTIRVLSLRPFTIFNKPRLKAQKRKWVQAAASRASSPVSLPANSSSCSTTICCCSLVIPGNIGSERISAAAFSAIGKSPTLCPRWLYAF